MDAINQAISDATALWQTRDKVHEIFRVQLKNAPSPQRKIHRKILAGKMMNNHQQPVEQSTRKANMPICTLKSKIQP